MWNKSPKQDSKNLFEKSPKFFQNGWWMGLVPSLDHDHPQNIPYHIWEVSISAEAYKCIYTGIKGNSSELDLATQN